MSTDKHYPLLNRILIPDFERDVTIEGESYCRVGLGRIEESVERTDQSRVLMTVSDSSLEHSSHDTEEHEDRSG